MFAFHMVCLSFVANKYRLKYELCLAELCLFELTLFSDPAATTVPRDLLSSCWPALKTMLNLAFFVKKTVRLLRIVLVKVVVLCRQGQPDANAIVGARQGRSEPQDWAVITPNRRAAQRRAASDRRIGSSAGRAWLG